MKLHEFLNLDMPDLLPVQARAQKILKLRKQCFEGGIDETDWPLDPTTAEFNLDSGGKIRPERPHEFARLVEMASKEAREGLGPAWDYVMNAIAWGFDIPDDVIIQLAIRAAQNSAEIDRLYFGG
jgi:hypothetical protein